MEGLAATLVCAPCAPYRHRHVRPTRDDYAVGIFLCLGAGSKSCGNTALDRTFQPGRGLLSFVQSPIPLDDLQLVPARLEQSADIFSDPSSQVEFGLVALYRSIQIIEKLRAIPLEDFGYLDFSALFIHTEMPHVVDELLRSGLKILVQRRAGVRRRLQRQTTSIRTDNGKVGSHVLVVCNQPIVFNFADRQLLAGYFKLEFVEKGVSTSLS